MRRLRELAEAAGGRHDPCGMCDGAGPWETPWGVEDDIKGDGHWDNEFHVRTENGEGSGLATFEYRPHAEFFATFDPPTVLALLDVAEAAEWCEREPCEFRGTDGDHFCTDDTDLDDDECCVRCLVVRALARLREVQA